MNNLCLWNVPKQQCSIQYITIVLLSPKQSTTREDLTSSIDGNDGMERDVLKYFTDAFRKHASRCNLAIQPYKDLFILGATIEIVSPIPTSLK